MTPTCTCHVADWFTGDQSLVITIQCPVHGKGPDATGPTIAPDPATYQKEENKNETR